ncbi:hypothetical protein [Pseudooceanicola sp. LIPI14-2-Ac024]|uniref:hypothetical protein n=1 Tax=Pseudooceanicola sp. LIPI14-2-Ac024 TaxID=3344875 RepID=UPI0035D13643
MSIHSAQTGPMPGALVHLGLPKTGSTSIQSFLAANRAAVRAQGLAYEPLGRSFNHAELLVVTRHRMGLMVDDPVLRDRFGIRLRNRDDQAAVVARTEARLRGIIAGAGGARVLLSCEMLGWPYRAPAFARAFHDWLSEFFGEVRYVAYLRAQDRWMESEYFQRLKHGQSHTVAEFLAKLDPPNYLRLARNWAAVAGPDALQLRLLEPDALKERDIVTDFCAAAGLDPTGLSRPGAVNARASMRQVAALRRVNAALGPMLSGSGPGRTVLRGLGEGTLRLVPADTRRMEFPPARGTGSPRRWPTATRRCAGRGSRIVRACSPA